MSLHKLDIGDKFETETGLWSVTDKGTRTIIAIKCRDGDEDWWKGPPYAVEEVVFDEDDIEGITE